MNFKNTITKKGNKIYIEVSADNFYSVHKKHRKRIRIEELDMVKLIKEAGYKCGKAIETNIFDNKKTTKTISIFEEKKAPIKKVTHPAPVHTTRKPYSKKSRKSQKKLDNIEKDVIIKETITEE